MGFLDKIKSAKNFVTGGGAKVQIQIPGNATRGETVPVLVKAQVAGAPLKVTKVYILVRARENVSLSIRHDGDKVHVNEDHETFSQEFAVTGPLNLEAESQNEWSADIQLPTNVAGSYRGHNSNHLWEFKAALDVKGNDPDSGWQELPVQ